MDQLVFSESVDTESSEPIMMDRQWLYVNDNNAQSYTGQVVLDTTSLSNSGAYMDRNESFLCYPVGAANAGVGKFVCNSSIGLDDGNEIRLLADFKFNAGRV